MTSKKKIGKKKRKNMSRETRSSLLKYAGIAVGVLAVFTLVSTVSYLFTWTVDHSLINEGRIVDKAAVTNWAGAAGLRWSNFLIARCFGLGSYVLVFLLGLSSIRLFRWDRSIGLLRIAAVSVSGAFIGSLALAYISMVCGIDYCLGGGLGGFAGASVVGWLSRELGNIVTPLLIALLFIAWLLLSSSRFVMWFSELGMKCRSENAEDLGEDDKVNVGDGIDGDGVGDSAETEDEPEEETETEPEEDMEAETEGETEDETEAEGDGDGEVGSDVNGGEETGDPGLEVIIDDDYNSDVTEELPAIDNRQELERYSFPPPLDMLRDYSESQHVLSQQELEENNTRIRATLRNFKIEVDKVTAVVGPTVTLYKVVPAAGVKISSIENLHKEIAMSLGVNGVRVVTLADSVGIEVPNSKPSIVPLKAMLNSEKFRNTTAELPVAIGYTITQEVKTFDLADAPHLLVAGATKQGKSVGLNVIIASLLYSKHPSELKFVFIDPKTVEFTAYNSLLKHYLAVLPMAASEEEERRNAIVKKSKQAEQVLNALCIEMDQRYDLLAQAGVNDFKLYNDKYKNRFLRPDEGHKFLPYLVVVIDEYADLIMAGGASPEAKKSAKSVENSIIRLAQKGRAAGIHVIIATQRPSVTVITGLIKANFPTRIAFRVLSGVDSRTILDTVGAENLIGKGDMLYYAGVKMERVQCALVSMAEINKITKYIGDQNGFKQCYSTPYYLPVPESQDGEPGGGTIDVQNLDPWFADAARMVVVNQKGSTSDLQRRLGMGYARAGRVMDQLEAAGVVGPPDGSKPRQVLVADLEELNEILSHFIS